MNIPPAVATHFYLNCLLHSRSLEHRLIVSKISDIVGRKVLKRLNTRSNPRSTCCIKVLGQCMPWEHEREKAKLCMPSPHAQSPCSDGATIDDHEAPSFPLTDMNKIKRWNMDKVNECGKAITASRSCSTASWRSPWSWRAGRPRRVCECCWMMHRGRRRDRGAASGSRFGISLHIWLWTIQIQASIRLIPNCVKRLHKIRLD